MTTVRLATRGSALALTQSRAVAARIEAELGVEVALVPLETTELWQFIREHEGEGVFQLLPESYTFEPGTGGRPRPLRRHLRRLNATRPSWC